MTASRAEQGFAIIHGVFLPAEMRQTLVNLSAVDLDRTKAGERHVISVPVVRQRPPHRDTDRNA
jgi:hypothetical protein